MKIRNKAQDICGQGYKFDFRGQDLHCCPQNCKITNRHGYRCKQCRNSLWTYQELFQESRMDYIRKRRNLN